MSKKSEYFLGNTKWLRPKFSPITALIIEPIILLSPRSNRSNHFTIQACMLSAWQIEWNFSALTRVTSESLGSTASLKLLGKYGALTARLLSYFAHKVRSWFTNSFIIKKILLVSQSKAGLAFLIYGMPNISLQPVILGSKTIITSEVHEPSCPWVLMATWYYL